VVPNAALHDLGEIVGSTLERASKLLAKHHVEVELSADLPMLSVDAVLFEQVLFNLLDNAAKYAPAHTAIRIQSWRDAKTAGLQILDEGSGIPPADLERIFDKFYRVRKEDQVRAAPAGLRSRAAHRALRLTGRQPHRSLRRRLHHRAADPAGRRRERGGHMSAPVKILVVDDEPAIRKLLRTGLGTQGYEVLEAPNGKAALELLAKKPDLVILDLGLPDIEGLELLKRIRAAQSGLPIVVLSSRGDEAGKVQPSISALTTTSPSRSAWRSWPHADGAASPAAGRAARVPARRFERRFGAGSSGKAAPR
jgi:CheY-like chemotaxis protein